MFSKNGFWTPHYKPCTCGAKRLTFAGESGAPVYWCCVPTYLEGRLVALGLVWLHDLPKGAANRCTLRQAETFVTNCPKPPEGMTTALYRRFDRDGLLLYVGISDDLLDRTLWHLANSPWFPYAETGTETWFALRVDAAAAEVVAIKEEMPLFNRQHASADRREAAARYILRRAAEAPSPDPLAAALAAVRPASSRLDHIMLEEKKSA